jgi:hypothetical protein
MSSLGKIVPCLKSPFGPGNSQFSGYRSPSAQAFDRSSTAIPLLTVATAQPAYQSDSTLGQIQVTLTLANLRLPTWKIWVDPAPTSVPRSSMRWPSIRTAPCLIMRNASDVLPTRPASFNR